jgi:TatD DNase family protein
MLVDSHCHLDFGEFAGQLPDLLSAMAQNDVRYALCAGVTLEAFPALLNMVSAHPNLFAAVGVHPDNLDCQEPDLETLVEFAAKPRVVAIGETGLDYYRLKGDLEWQRQRFRMHIEAAHRSGKPLIIHTRSAAEDTVAILRHERAADVGGVFHCFTETIETARAALDLGFYISFSGIVTFKNATDLKTVAQFVPLDRLLVETDSPYLAPVPHRGRRNQPAYVRHVAEEVARLRGIEFEAVAAATTENFFRLFSAADRIRRAL